MTQGQLKTMVERILITQVANHQQLLPSQAAGVGKDLRIICHDQIEAAIDQHRFCLAKRDQAPVEVV